MTAAFSCEIGEEIFRKGIYNPLEIVYNNARKSIAG